MAKVVDYHFQLVTKDRVASILCFLSCLRKPAGMLWAALWMGPYDKELREAFGQQPVKNWGSHSKSHEKLNPDNNVWVIFEVDPSPVKPSNEIEVLVDFLIIDLWDTLKQKCLAKVNLDSFPKETIK